MRSLFVLFLLLTNAAWAAQPPAQILEMGQPCVITVSKKGSTFSLTQRATTYAALHVALPEGGRIKVSCAYAAQWGDYRVAKKYEKHLDSVISREWLLDDLPQLDGTFVWNVQNVGKTESVDVHFTARELGALPEVNMGEKTGGIQIMNAAGRGAMLLPDADLELRHADMDASPSVDMTPSGDGLAWAPAGLWSVRVAGDKGQRVRYVQSNLVPVGQGMMTQVQWPVMQIGENGDKEISANVRIRQVRAEEDRAVLRVAVKNGIDLESITTETAEVFEAGRKGRVLAVRRAEEPLDVVVLLDSSGSMKKDMARVSQAASRFIAGLPQDAHVRLVDFDTKPTIVQAGTREELLSRLMAIKANGATALYDALILGLGMEPASSRRAVVLFSDGMDANYNDTGPGSSASRKEMLATALGAGVPVFSIGYGKAPDETTLSLIAASTGGAYYPADENSIDEVFAKITSILGQDLDIEYRRPEVREAGDAPAISIVMDTSGSMEVAPKECEGCGYKMQRAKELVRDFILNLPPEVPVQLAGFSSDVQVTQIMTTDRQALLRGVSLLRASGGTDILTAAEYGFASLENVPSTRRILLFITDAALKVPDKEAQRFTLLQERLRDKGIFTVWTGMVDARHEKAFAQAARISGGTHVVSPDTEVLQAAMSAIKSRLNAAGESNRTAVQTVIRARDLEGQAATGADSLLAELPAPPKAAEKDSVRVASYEFAPMPNQYTPEASEWIYGQAAPFRDVQISKQIALDAAGSNSAVRISVRDIFLLRKVAGVQAPNRRQFAVLRLMMENILPEQDVIVAKNGSQHPSAWVKADAGSTSTVRKIPPYLIRDLACHMFLNVNSRGQNPPSELTALTEKALMTPDGHSIFVQPGQPVEGTVLFEIGDEPLASLSLHFYDTAYGHLDVPLIGKIDPLAAALPNLPRSAPVKLSEAFDLSVDGFVDFKSPLNGHVPDKSALWRTLDMSVSSKVQALMDFDASRLMYLSFSTPRGMLMVSPDPLTRTLPFGFHSGTVLAPGSFNRLRQAYLLPVGLENQPCHVFMDLRGEDVLVPVGSPPKSASGGAAGIEGSGISVVVNGFFQTPGKFVAADLTLSDAPDGKATRLGDPFVLVPEKEAPKKQEKDTQSRGLGSLSGNSKQEKRSVADTLKLIFGLSKDTVIPDGVSRRVVVLFKPGKDDGPLVLTSPFFPDLRQPVAFTPNPDAELLLAKNTVQRPPSSLAETQAMNKAIEQAVAARKAEGWVRPGSGTLERLAGHEDETGVSAEVATSLPHPVLTSWGQARWQEMLDLDRQAFLSRLAALKAVPSAGLNGHDTRAWLTGFAPEAVLMQGWGRPADLARMFELYLHRQGVKTMRKIVTAPWTTSGASGSKDLFFPALEHDNVVTAFPFLSEAWTGPVQEYKGKSIGGEARIKVVAYAGAGSGAAAKTGVAASALSGGSQAKGVELLEAGIALEQASLDAFDLSFPGGRTALMEGVFGTVRGEKSLEPGQVCERIEIIIKTADADSSRSHVIVLDQGTSLEKVFVSLGVYLPDLGAQASDHLSAIWKSRKPDQSPDELSALRWYARSVMYRFLAAQTEAEQRLAETLEVSAERADRGRIVAMNVVRRGDKLVSSIDLVRTAPEVTGDPEARRAFAVMAGFTDSVCEQAAIGGQGGVEQWSSDKSFVVISPARMKKAGVGPLVEQGISPHVAGRLMGGKNWILFPRILPHRDGVLSPYWFEVDPKTYETVFVLGSGYRGATETVSLETLMSLNSFAVGFMVGVTTSVWAVADFATGDLDPEVMLGKARELAESILKSMNGIGGEPEIPMDGTRMKVTLSGIEFDDGKDSSFAKFSDGYKAGVAFYFAKAR